MNLRMERLKFLAPFLQDPAREFLNSVQKDLGHAMFVVVTWRSTHEQMKIYQTGRALVDGQWVVTDKKAVVTNALPGSSPHNVITHTGNPASMALDTVPMLPTGELFWNLPVDEWHKIWAIAWKFGLDPLGDTIGAYYQRDLCHFEEPAWALKLSGLGLVKPSMDVTPI